MMGTEDCICGYADYVAARSGRKRTKAELAHIKPASYTAPGTRSKAKHQPRKKAGRHSTRRSR